MVSMADNADNNTPENRIENITALYERARGNKTALSDGDFEPSLARPRELGLRDTYKRAGAPEDQKEIFRDTEPEQNRQEEIRKLLDRARQHSRGISRDRTRDFERER